MREEELESTRAELQRARKEAAGLRDELRSQEAGAALRLEKVAGVQWHKRGARPLTRHFF